MKKIATICLLWYGLSFSTELSAQTDIVFYTTMGVFEAEMYDTLQPITAGNFISLVEEEFYDGIIFHRVVEGFVIQGGDPLGTGFGGPGYTIDDEFDDLASNVKMAFGMANSGPNTAGSQFYINLVDNVYLDPSYPVFGIVTENFDVVEAIGEVPVNAADKPITPVVMDSVRIKQTAPTGINTAKDNIITITVSPNPASDFINISTLSTAINYTVSIINNTGQSFWDCQLENNLQIPTGNLLSGNYFVIIKSDDQKIVNVKKIVISN